MSRFGYLVTTYVMALAVGIFSLFHHTPRLMWNASASTPSGSTACILLAISGSAILSPTGHRLRFRASWPSAGICRSACRCSNMSAHFPDRPYADMAACLG